jgi:methyl-accepting chemotaxis protein
MIRKFYSEKNSLTLSDDLFAEVMVRNNRRLFVSFFTILLLANLATIGIKASGKGSEYLSYQSIIIECVLAFSILIIGFYLAKRMRGHWSSSYISITGSSLASLSFST